MCFSLELILREVPPDPAPQNPEGGEEQPLEDRAGLFAGYQKRRKQETTSRPETQLNSYLSLDTEETCLTFWETNKKSFPALYPIAMRALAVPATSAPVERVFSHGGIILRPNRSRMKDTTLSHLIFLKCNQK